MRAKKAVNIYSTTGKIVDNISLPKEVFAASVINPKLLSQAVRIYLANSRAGHASTKTRGEVKGSTRKIRRQKHTGRARHGSIRAPIFVGGGLAFGPKPRSYKLSLPKNMKKKALYSALTSKLQEENLKVVEGLEKISPKTKDMLKVVGNIVKDGKRKILLILPKKIDNLERASRNITGLTIRQLHSLNTYEVLKADMLLFTKQAIEGLIKKYENK